MKISQKLKELRKNINLTQQEFAAQIGVNTKTIAFWENDKNEPTKSNLLTICNKFNLSDDYFNENVKNNVRIVSVISNEPKIKADYYPDVLGSCGGGAFELSQEHYTVELPVDCFFKEISKNKTYSVINAYGDSMLETIKDGDKLIIEHTETEPIQDNKIYVFCYDNQIYVKRLINNIDELVVVSDNPDKTIYKTKYISKADRDNLYLIGQVVGLARNLR
jgi:phage repressor protein C with HTH and peptisase S24 domain